MMDKKKLLAQIDSLPTLPISVSRLAALIENEQSSLADFEDAIRPDASLTTNLLRIANSAFFRRSRKISSVKHAIAMLGEKRVFEIILTAGFSRVMPKILPGYGIDSLNFWHHNVSVAILSEHLALELNIPDQEMIFTAGLLHDVGKLVIGTFLAEDSSILAQKLGEESAPFVEVERAILGVDHMEVGQDVTEKWNLPREITAVARYHHDPDNGEIGDYQFLVDIIHVSDGLAHMMGYGADVGELIRRIEPETVDRLKLTVQKLEITASETAEQIIDMLEIFKNT